MRSSPGAIIITGASSGLGAALAEAYAGPQTVLGLLGRDGNRLGETANVCEAKGSAIRMAAIDVVEARAMAEWLAEFDRDHPAELVIANAGTSAGPEPGSPSEGVETATRQVKVNLLGSINTVEPLLPALCQRGHGQVVFVASIAAYRGLPDSPGYCASKAGLRAYAEALRPRLAAHGVKSDDRVPRLLRFTDDRPLRRADAVSDQPRGSGSCRQTRHRSRTAPRRISMAACSRPAVLRLGASLCRRRHHAALSLSHSPGLLE